MLEVGVAGQMLRVINSLHIWRLWALNLPVWDYLTVMIYLGYHHQIGHGIREITDDRPH